MNKQNPTSVQKKMPTHTYDPAKYMHEECPECHFVFMNLDDPYMVRECPSCHYRFKHGQKKVHQKHCPVCNLRYHGGNNVYFKEGCPALMSDGRFLTYYNSTNELTEAMRKVNGFRSANQFRNFMQTNGDLFMATERDFLINKNTCAPVTACSEGWYDLWTKLGRYWACNYASDYSLNH